MRHRRLASVMSPRMNTTPSYGGHRLPSLDGGEAEVANFFMVPLRSELRRSSLLQR